MYQLKMRKWIFAKLFYECSFFLFYLLILYLILFLILDLLLLDSLRIFLELFPHYIHLFLQNIHLSFLLIHDWFLFLLFFHFYLIFLLLLNNGYVFSFIYYNGSQYANRDISTTTLTLEEAENFTPPEWFGEDVTFDGSYHNSAMSKGAHLKN